MTRPSLIESAIKECSRVAHHSKSCRELRAPLADLSHQLEHRPVHLIKRRSSLNRRGNGSQIQMINWKTISLLPRPMTMGSNQRPNLNPLSKRSLRHQVLTVENQVTPSAQIKMSGNHQHRPKTSGNHQHRLKTSGNHRHRPRATLCPLSRSRLLRRRPTPPSLRALSSRAAPQTPSLSAPAQLAPPARLLRPPNPPK